MQRASWAIAAAGTLTAAILILAAAGGAERADAPPVKPGLYWSETPLLFDGTPTTAKEASSRPAPDDRGFIRPPRTEMQVGLEVLVDGRPLPTIRHAGRTYLPVPAVGDEYQLRVWNHGPRRIVAVVSVDGLSVISGEPASEAQPGYIVGPYGSIVIKGWRRSLDRVAAFRFVDRDRSYAGLVGKPENIGVIGLVAFEELVARPMPAIEKQAAPAAERARGDVGSIGTEYGRDLDSRVVQVPFVRSGNRQAVTIWYDTAEQLRKAGIPVDGTRPEPFPGDWRFAPPPPGYRNE